MVFLTDWSGSMSEESAEQRVYREIQDRVTKMANSIQDTRGILTSQQLSLDKLCEQRDCIHKWKFMGSVIFEESRCEKCGYTDMV